MRKVSKRLGAVVGVLMSASFLPMVAPANAVVAPVGQGFAVTASDLSFILKQIKIAEAHVANTTSLTGPCGALVGTGLNQIPSPLVSMGLRTVDGSCNNLQPGQETFGAADQTFPRLGSKKFLPAEGAPTGFFGPSPVPASSSYAQKKGNVFDTEPRIVSNLIVDQTSTNPAAIAAAGAPVRTQGNTGVVPCTTDPKPAIAAVPGVIEVLAVAAVAAVAEIPAVVGVVASEGVLAVEAAPAVPAVAAVEAVAPVAAVAAIPAVPAVVGFPTGCTPSHQTLFIPNVTTDVGLSPPYNSLFTLFGQFFDHGVDQTVKGGGKVYIPLKSDDPLIAGPDHDIATVADNLPPHLRFMVLTRGQNQPGPDGILGDLRSTPDLDESADDVQDAKNTNSPWVDQSQTYTSHASHQLFLREYANNTAPTRSRTLQPVCRTGLPLGAPYSRCSSIKGT